jgi:phage terminase Nu1 subunit (DNA packaging protein)
MSTMTEAVSSDGPPAAEPVSRRRSEKAATVSASALAHLDCSRTYIGKLEAEGVIQRQGDGFPLDQSRVAYLRYLRREHRRSPRTEADAAHVAVKTEMLQLRLMEKKHELVRRDAFDELIDQIAGTVLTHLSGMSARCSRDMVVRRNIDAVVMQIRREIAEACSKAADECNEPPLNEQH